VHPPRPHIDALIATTSQSLMQERPRGTKFADLLILTRLGRLCPAPGCQIALSHDQDPNLPFLVNPQASLADPESRLIASLKSNCARFTSQASRPYATHRTNVQRLLDA
jgi:hypothetical protein